MPITVAQVGEANIQLQATECVVLYKGTQDYDQYGCAVRHDLVEDKLTNPRVVDPKSLVLMSMSLLKGRQKKASYLDARILAAEPGKVAWHRPQSAKAVPLFYQTTSPKIDALDGMNVCLPPLLFVAEWGNLWVYGLAQDDRPGPETRLYRAPFWNTYEEGHMCNGNLKLPDPLPGNIEEIEKVYFESNFTHASTQRRQTSHPKGFVGYWKSRKRRNKSNPAQHLIRLKRKLKDVL